MNLERAYELAAGNLLETPNYVSAGHTRASMRRLVASLLSRMYGGGFFGAFLVEEGPEWARTIARHERDQLLAELACETRLEAAIPLEYQGTGRGKRAVNWNNAMQIDPRILSGSQDYGNCTSWALREIVGCEWCTDILARDELQAYTARPGTAVPYGSRGHSGQGSALGTLANVVNKRGVQVEAVYCDGQYDLRTEQADESYGNRWGGNGPPQCILDEIQHDRIEQISYATEADAVLDVLQLGHFCFHGSTLTAKQNNTLISPLASIGGHAQALIGYDDTDEFRDWAQQTLNVDLRGDWVAINDQSWGPWNRFPDTQWPEHLWGRRPEGVWVISGQDMMRIVRQWKDCIAVSNQLGFPKRLGWGMFG